MSNKQAKIPPQEAYLHPVDDFLKKHERWIAAPERAKIREAAAKTILHGADIDLTGCPEDSRDELRRTILESRYKKRVAGRILKPETVMIPDNKPAHNHKSVILPYRQKKLY